jgi:hypothetical protein
MIAATGARLRQEEALAQRKEALARCNAANAAPSANAAPADTGRVGAIAEVECASTFQVVAAVIACAPDAPSPSASIEPHVHDLGLRGRDREPWLGCP